MRTATTLTHETQVDGTISKMDGVEVISSDTAVRFFLCVFDGAQVNLVRANVTVSVSFSLISTAGLDHR